MNDHGHHTRVSVMNPSRMPLFAVCLLASALVSAQAPPAADASRGELLYSTHCVACHTAQIHWRDKKLATNWASLKAQVSRWQANGGLGWRDADIVEVTRYLNELHYHFPQTGDQLGLAERDCPASKDASSSSTRSGMARIASLFTARVPAHRCAAT
jgi:hypothetical protein